MATISQILSELKKKKPLMNVVDVLSLNSYLAITKSEILGKIKGEKALVGAKRLENGYLDLFIKIPLMDDSHEELRVWGEGEYIEEGDEVWISSILAVFLVNNKGETVVRFDAKCVDKQRPQNVDEIKEDIVKRSTDYLLSNKKGPLINLVYDSGKCPEGNYSLLTTNDNTIIKIRDNNGWRVIQLPNYVSARPLTHGLILARAKQSVEGVYDILNTDGSVFCSGVKRTDYGPDYVNCKERLWIFNDVSNLWEEKVYGEYHVVQGTVGENLIGVYIITESPNINKYRKRIVKKYFFINYNGEVEIEIPQGYAIYSGFHNGYAKIYMTDDYHGEYYEETIDKEGKTIKQYNRSFPGYLADIERDNLRSFDRENWDAMTDGMCGDYPDDGYDGDYEFMGR